MSQQHPNQPFRPEHNVVGNSPLNPNYPPPPPPKKRHTVRNVLLVIAGVFVLGIGGCTAIVASIGGTANNATKHSAAPSASPVDNGPTPDPVITPTNKPTAVKPTIQPSPKVTHKPAPPMTAGQVQAIGSAESYLSLTAFSRKGLIHQLSSSAGEGFSVADATFAVDHITVNWNEQAAKSAKSYLQMTHFSRQGLIHQLESSAGEGFTHAQAVYGVTKAGL